MKTFQYIARDFSGGRKEGLRQAVSSNDVLSWLRERGFTPISIDEISGQIRKKRRMRRHSSVRSPDLAALCWQLTTMVEGGIPITSAIDTISEDIDNARLQEILREVLDKMETGVPFSECLAEYPRVFNKLACALILAGETGGNLPESLRRLAMYFDNRDKLVKKVKGATAYPAFVFTFVVLIVIFIMTFIIPRFRVIFNQMGGQLPAFTRGFMHFYDILRFNIVYIIGSVLLLIVLGILIYTRSKKGHYTFCKIALGFPMLGKLFKQAFIVMFCRTMSTLISAGVSVLEVFDILAEMTSNDILKNAVVKARELITEGSNVSLGMAASGVFPNMLVKMIQVGEESGSLPTVLDRTADYYERKVDSTITTLMALLEPTMIVTVGIIVLVIVLALYLPIFTMSQNVPH